MSQPQPQDFDAVLGGRNQPELNAVVLGGIDGLERKIAHELRSRTDPHNVDSAGWKLPEPIDPVTERERLQKLAQALSTRQIECQFIEPAPDLLDRLSDRGRRDFDRDLRVVSTQRIVRNFPWDKTGRIELKTAENDLAMRSLLLLNDGKIDEALGFYGITLSAILHQLMGDIQIKYYTYYDFTDDERIRWRSLLFDTLRQSAPWKLPQALITESARIKHWASQKKSRKQHWPFLKLALFPNQRHTHKTCPILVGEMDGSNPRLIMTDDANNDRLHFTAWKRSIEVDFDRYGIEFDRS